MLVDGVGKRGEHQLSGLTDTMKRAVFDKPVIDGVDSDKFKRGDFVLVEVDDATQNTLFCSPIEHMGIDKYFEIFNGNRKADYLKQ